MHPAERKLNEIAKFLIDTDESESSSGDLFTGSAGMALFMFYYSRHIRSKACREKAMSYLQHAVQRIDEQVPSKPNHTFCLGISGVCWTIHHLASNGFIEKDNTEILNYFDNFLATTALMSFQAGNYDFLHGGTGTAIYLLKRSARDSVKRPIEEIIEVLNENKKEVNGQYYWNHGMGHLANGISCNLSISHGMASTCIFLTKASNANIKRATADRLLDKSCKFLLNQEVKNAKRTAMFPSYSFVPHQLEQWANDSRLGWCYGDLGTALAMWHYSKHSGNKTFEKKTQEILQFSTSRRNLEENSVVDAGICHGTAGIALIFKRMHSNTKIEELKKTSIFWLQETISMATYEDGYCGYKADRNHAALGLLEGIAGIGLVLLSFITEEESKWDECLLLS